MVKSFLTLVLGLLPSSFLKNFMLKSLGWKIGARAKIGSNIFIHMGAVKIGKGSIVRPLNIFRNVSLDFGDNSIFGSLNWVSAAQGLESQENFRGHLSMGRESVINSRNYFDVSGGVYFGDFSDLAGVRSTFITHQIDMSTSLQTCNQIKIGHHTMICSNSLVVPGGTEIGNCCIFAMGSIIRARNYPHNGFYAGAPATLKKMTTGDWYHRDHGPVH